MSDSLDLVARVSALRVEHGRHIVLNHVDMQVRRGESLAITGDSGSGKSTLLSCLMGLTQPTEGAVEVAGSLGPATSARKGAMLRRTRLGVVFQSGEFLEELSASENVMFAGLIGGLNHREASSRADDLLSDFGIMDGSRPISTYSGGEQQRVSVARALINAPQLLLADEPTAALDPRNRDEVCAALFSAPRTTGCGLVVVTHDPAVAQFADRTARLVNGTLE